MTEQTESLIETLARTHTLTKDEYAALISLCREEQNSRKLLAKKAVELRKKYYQTKVYTRGLIEFTNYCKNNCYYCGIRAENQSLQRYRLSKEEILDCVHEGYLLGFRTFVLQGGEDPFFRPKDIGRLIEKIKESYPDCAVTLSFGEHDKKTYRYWYECGADRYLLRHETALKPHYEKLHPAGMSYDNRIRCLYILKEIGYQTGAGFMVGSPGQTALHLAEELLFLKKLEPDMVGIGPFIPARKTPFETEPAGSLEDTLIMLSLLRLTLPDVLLPATTALGTIHPLGRELGIKAGANVVMPNLSPVSVRDKYRLYDNKICTGDESAQCKDCLNQRMKSIGYRLVTDRGDRYGKEKNRVFSSAESDS